MHIYINTFTNNHIQNACLKQAFLLPEQQKDTPVFGNKRKQFELNSLVFNPYFTAKLLLFVATCSPQQVFLPTTSAHL